MEKSKEQILIEKLRKVSHKVRMGRMMPPGMPPMGAPGQMGPGFPGKMCRNMGRPGMTPPPMCHRGPGMGQPPMAPHGLGMMQPPLGQPGRMCPPKMEGEGHGCHGGQNGHGCHGRPGLMPREMLLLAVLDQGENGIRQKDLAQHIGINASSLSEQIDRLEADRYLERRENPDDKRSTLIFLTEKGKARAWEVQDERQKSAEQLCGKLTDEEKDTLIGLLDKLLAE